MRRRRSRACVSEIETEQSTTDEMPTFKNSFHRSWKVHCRSCFHDVAPRSEAESFLRDCSRTLLRHEDYFGFWANVANLSGGLNSIQCRESDVQKNQIGFQRCRF